MTKFSFEITLSNQTIASDDLAEATFEAGCTDATMASRDGVVTLIFDREAADLETAIASAIKQLRDAQCSVAKIEILELPAAA